MEKLEERNANIKETLHLYYEQNLSTREISETVRSYWQVENNLHWQLDASFREDYTRKTNNAAINFSTMCKIELILLKQSDLKIGIAEKKEKYVDGTKNLEIKFLALILLVLFIECLPYIPSKLNNFHIKNVF